MYLMGNYLNLKCSSLFKPSKPEGVHYIVTAKPHPSVIHTVENIFLYYIICYKQFNLHVVLATLIMSKVQVGYFNFVVAILLVCFVPLHVLSFFWKMFLYYIYVGLLYRSG